MILGILTGHTLAEPGAKCPGMETEEVYNNRLAVAIEERIGVHPGIVFISAPGAPGNGVSERWQMAKEVRVTHVIELHHNCLEGRPAGDYAEILYYGPSWRGRDMAHYFESALYPRILLKHGIQRIRSTPLPNKSYGHISIIEDTPWPAIIIEPAFVDQEAHRMYFTPEAQRRFGTELADIIMAWQRAGR